MKKIVSPLLEKNISLEDAGLITLVIENRQLLYEVCQFCCLDFRGKKEYISVIDDDLKDPLPLIFIENPFVLDYNNKKNLNALYRTLKGKYWSELSSDLSKINECIQKVISSIVLDFDVELSSVQDVDLDDLLKLSNIRFVEKEGSFVERLINYIVVCHELQFVNIFVFYGLRILMDDTELSQMLKELSYRNIKIIDIEGIKPSKIIDSESIYCIDSDLCNL